MISLLFAEWKLGYLAAGQVGVLFVRGVAYGRLAS